MRDLDLFAWHPVEVAGRGQLCSGWAARRRRRRFDFISDYLWAEPHGGRGADRTLVATSGLALIRASGPRGCLRLVRRSAGGWCVCFFFSNWKAVFDTDVSKQYTLTSAILLALLGTLGGASVSPQIPPRLNIFTVKIQLISCFHGHAEEEEGDSDSHYVRRYESEASIRALQHASATHSFARRSRRWRWVYRRAGIWQCLCRTDAVSRHLMTKNKYAARCLVRFYFASLLDFGNETDLLLLLFCVYFLHRCTQ